MFGFLMGRGPPTTVFMGTTFPGFFTEELHRSFREEHSLESGDIVICSFPRSGTNLNIQIVNSLLAGEICKDLPYGKDLAPFMEMDAGFRKMTVQQIQAFRPDPKVQQMSPTPRRVLKTHLPAPNAPWIQESDDIAAGKVTIPKGAKVILVIRDPLDNALSMYRFLYKSKLLDKSEQHGLRRMLRDKFLPGKNVYGDYWKWHKGWLTTYESYASEGANYDGRVLLIKYEEINRDKRAAIAKIGNFILSEPPSSELIDAVVESTNIEYMKKTAKNTYKGYFGKGLIGGGKKMLDEDSTNRFMNHHKAKCSELGLDPKIWDIGSQAAGEA